MMIREHVKEHLAMGYSSGAPQKPIPKGSMVMVGESIVYQMDYNSWKQPCGPVHVANWRLGCPFTSIVNRGINSAQTAAILAAFPADVLTRNPGWVFIHAGVNNITLQVYSTYTLTQIRAVVAAAWADILSMVTMARSAGIRVILSTIYPNADSTVAKEERSTGMMLLNRKIIEYCSRVPDVLLFDPNHWLLTWDTLANAALFKADGQYFSPAEPSSVHMGVKGGNASGNVMYNLLSTVIPRRRSGANGAWDGTGGDVDNGIKNSVLIGTTGTKGAGVTGSVADYWEVGYYRQAFTTTTVAASKTTHWDGSPVPVQRIVVASQPAPQPYTDTDDNFDYDELVAIKAPLLTLSGSQFAVGDTVFCEIEANNTVTAGDAFCSMLLVEFQDGVGGYTKRLAANAPMGGVSGSVVDFATCRADDVMIRTAEYAIPANTVSIQVWFLVMTSTGGEVQWDIARPQLCKVQTY